jgi:hypothetical protein
MKRKLLIAATTFTLALGMQSTASAAIQAIQLEEGTAAGSIVNGDKTFSNFFCHLNTLNPFATPVQCSDISVIPFVDALGNFGISYGGSFTANATDGVGIVDVRLSYDVAAPAATIVDVHMHFDATFAPANTTAVLLANVTETVDGSNPAFVSAGQISVSLGNPPPVLELDASANLAGGPYQSLHVSKDVLLQAFANGPIPNGTVLFTTLTQTFSQVIPEPGSIVLFGTALLGCAAVLRRRMAR